MTRTVAAAAASFPAMARDSHIAASRAPRTPTVVESSRASALVATAATDPAAAAALATTTGSVRAGYALWASAAFVARPTRRRRCVVPARCVRATAADTP